MSQPTQSRTFRPSALRSRAAVLAAGLGVSMVAGAGAAFAATGADADTGTRVSYVAGASPAEAVQKQATAQAGAAAKHATAVKAQHLKAEKAEKAAEKAKKARAAAAVKKAKSWTHPVDHYTLSATFGRGGTMWSHKHSGQDFAVPIGTAVHAAHGGTVVKAGPNGAGDGPAYGNAIVIRHADHTYSQYAHLSKIKVYVGQHVNTDQRIAFSGNTGNSSGPHLHFEIRTTPNYGSAINPVNYLRAEGVKV